MRDLGYFTFPAVAESLSAARNCVRGVLQSQDHANRELDINIVVGEILQNVVRYGFQGGDDKGIFSLHFFMEDSQLEVVVIDNAPPSNPDGWDNAHRKPEEGGHGLTIVHAIAQSVHFEALENGNKAVLSFALDDKPAS
ncbi:MAG: ATP-binding protein [Candidatus Puniceispirillaceae bacterium]